MGFIKPKPREYLNMDSHAALRINDVPKPQDVPDSAALYATIPEFTHAPLERTSGSIRLLRVLPDLSEDNLIQCSLWHDSTEATYTCLSYEWGSEGGLYFILMNGQVVRVGKNLWGFLNIARTKYASNNSALWVDALCINQRDIPERNHQVAQMGNIYSCASDVLAWLGFNKHTEEFFDFAIRLGTETRNSKKDVRQTWSQEQSPQLEDGWVAFWANSYWTRAWISQELLLAKTFRILANHTEIGRVELERVRLLFPMLEHTLTRSWPLWMNARRASHMSKIYVDVMAGALSTIRNEKLHKLLQILPGRACRISRDQVYSLLSIARDGAAVEVDYGSSDDDFFLHLGNTLRKSMCMCNLVEMAVVLDYQVTEEVGNQLWSIRQQHYLESKQHNCEILYDPDIASQLEEIAAQHLRVKRTKKKTPIRQKESVRTMVCGIEVPPVHIKAQRLFGSKVDVDEKIVRQVRGTYPEVIVTEEDKRRLELIANMKGRKIAFDPHMAVLSSRGSDRFQAVAGLKYLR